MGEKGTLEAMHGNLTSPTYKSKQRCRPDPWPWFIFDNKKLIEDCVGVPADVAYKVTVNSAGKSGSANVMVKFNAPDDVVFSISDGTGKKPKPSQTEPWEQTLTSKLTWNGQDLGACANVCFNERLKVKVPFAHQGPLRRLNFTQLPWFPSGCVSVVKGNIAKPNQVTTQCKSPYLKDRNVHNWNLSEFNCIQTLNPNDVIATRQHQYLFHGYECDQDQWGPLDKTVEFFSGRVSPNPGVQISELWEFPQTGNPTLIECSHNAFHDGLSTLLESPPASIVEYDKDFTWGDPGEAVDELFP